jgi:hypothetical protein
MHAMTLHSRLGNVQVDHSVPLVLLAWFFLPLATTLAVFCTAYNRTLRFLSLRAEPGHNKSGKKILITGSSPEAITLANAFHAAGNRVIGADYTRFPLISSAQISTAFTSYHNLYKQRYGGKEQKKRVLEGFGIRLEISSPFGWLWSPHSNLHLARDVVALIEREKPDLWIPCSSSHSALTPDDITKAVQSVRQRAICAILHAEEDTAEMLTDESAFAEYVEQLETGVRVPEFKTVTTRDEVHRILAAVPESRWELQYNGPTSGSETAVEDDESRVDGGDRRRWTWPPPRPSSINSESGDGSQPQSPRLRSTSRVVLPLRSRNATYHAIAGLLISPEHPWTMRESVTGQSITGHLLVVRNRLRGFAATLPQRGGIHGEAAEAELLPSTSLLSQPFQSFAEAFTASLPEDTTSFININFVVVGTATTMGTINTIFPVSCSVGVEPSAPALLMGSSDHAQMVVRAIFDAPSPKHGNGKRSTSDSRSMVNLGAPEKSSSLGVRGLYSLYPALLAVLLPLLRYIAGVGDFVDFSGSLLSSCEKLLLWRDAMFSVRDPWPWWWEWHVRLPLQYVVAKFNERA